MTARPFVCVFSWKALSEKQISHSLSAKAEDITITGPELLEMIDRYIAYYEVADFDELMNYQPLDSMVDYMVIDRIYSLLYDSAEISYE